MAKVDKEFNVKDWEWIAVHFPASERESMAKVAWIICCKCTPEKNSQHKIDPRIVIPLCAIELLDEINILQLKNCVLQLKKLETELSDCYYKRTDNYLINLLTERFEISEELKITQEHINEIKEDVDGIIQDFIDFVINLINPTERWLSLFKTLNIHLQFSLFSSLIKYRRPTRYDWRNIFLENSDVISDFDLVATLIYLRLNPAEGIISFFSSLSWILLMIILFDFFCKTTLLVKVIILVICSILWIYKQNIYRKVTNPLKNILKSYTSRTLLVIISVPCSILGMIILFNFFCKTTLLVKLIILVTCSILWIYQENIYCKVTNPLKDILKYEIYRNLANLDRFSC